MNTPPDRLDEMFLLQETMQRDLYGDGVHPANLPGPAQMNYLRTQSLALTDEIHEALAETGWKPWATSNHITRDAFHAEMVDAWHFFMNLMLVSGMTPQDLYEGYKAKQAKNYKRQADGYDGVSTKCPACKRAYDDAAVKCHPEREPENRTLNNVPAWCDFMQDFIPRLIQQGRINVGCQHVGCKIPGEHDHISGTKAADVMQPDLLMGDWKDLVNAKQEELPGLGIKPLPDPADYFKGRAA